jgi:hypothetical protein
VSDALPPIPTPQPDDYQPWPDHGLVMIRHITDGRDTEPIQLGCTCGYVPDNQDQPDGPQRARRRVERHIWSTQFDFWDDYTTSGLAVDDPEDDGSVRIVAAEPLGAAINVTLDAGARRRLIEILNRNLPEGD